MSSLPIKVKYTDSEAKRISMPRDGDLGIDLYSNEDCLVTEGQGTYLVGTGLSIELPRGFAFIIKDRSSMSKQFATLAGVIDNNYRGEIKVRLVAVNGCYKITKGEKIAQGIIVQDLNNKFFLKEVTELNDSNRGDKGFGSTGK